MTSDFGPNFASKGPAPWRLITAVIWFGAALTVVITAFSLREVAVLRDHLAKLNQHLEQSPATQTPEGAAVPSAAEVVGLSARVDRLNTLTGSRAAPILDVLDALESALTPDVWLANLSYDSGHGAARFALLGLSETPMADALARLESAGVFASTILERQVRLRRGQEILVQYEILAGTK